jgi:RimJ/RimL family protein N-acetyltransferase
MTRLRPITAADLPALEAQRLDAEAAGENNWFGFADPGWMRRRFDAGLITDEAGRLAVVDDGGSLVGEVQWVTAVNGPPPNGSCWNLGIWIAAEHRGRGHGSDAQRLGAAYLFDHTLKERVEAGTETGNLAEQRALEKAGFTREGVLRRACFRGGQWRDMVLFSKLRGEP